MEDENFGNPITDLMLYHCGNAKISSFFSFRNIITKIKLLKSILGLDRDLNSNP